MVARLVLTHPNVKLREISKEVDTSEFDKVQEWCRDIRDTMIANSKSSLAAPQVGIQKRIFAVNSIDFENPYAFLQDNGDGILYFINPEISFISSDTVKTAEQCSSVPKISFSIKRAADIQFTYFDKNNRLIQVKISGKDAAVVQHECDHLDGKLLIDRLNSFDRKEFLRLFEKPKRQMTEGEINQIRESRRAQAREKRKKKL